MWLNRVTPDPFENSKLESSNMGQEEDRVLSSNTGAVTFKFDRFGNGSRRSDFEVEISWRDVERLVAEFCKAKLPEALELQHALEVSKALKGAGWTPPAN